MNKDSNTLSFNLNSSAAAVFNLGRKGLAVALAYLMIPLGIGDVYAQTAPPPPPDQGQYSQAPPPPDQGQYPEQGGNYNQGPPPQAYNPLPPEQLDSLVAPIALYPDALVAQILAASTYPDEIADAENFLRANQGLPPDQLGNMANGMNWDPSIKALIAFPSVLYNLAQNMDWTTQLGNAYYNQPQDVMNAVQDMRARAYAAGNLRSNSQLAVDYQPGNIIIAPANPTIVYVPWYNPWVVYGAPVVAWGGYYPPPRPVGYYVAVGVAIGFGVGIAIASWNHWGWGYHYWGMGWRTHTVVYQRNVYISRSVRVVNHGYYGRYDRNVAARNYNMRVAHNAPNVRPNYRPSNNYRPNNNYHPTNNVRPAQNYNRPNNTRPAQNYNRPQQQPRPEQYNRPQQQQRPEQSNRPQQQRPQQYNRPESRPQARPQQQHPQSHPQSRSKPPKQNNHDHRR